MTDRRSMPKNKTENEVSVRRTGGVEGGLRIDTDDLDGCLIEQPDIYYHTALAHAEAVAKRDAAKLELEYVVATLDVNIRAGASALGEKTTEAAIQRGVQLDVGYLEAKKLHLSASTVVDRLQALKEAFQQRSFMLRELVALTIAERGDQAGASGAYEARGRRAQASERLRSEHIRERRRSNSEE